MNDSCIGGIRRYELEAYYENKQQVNNKEAEDNTPAGRKSDEVELEKRQAKTPVTQTLQNEKSQRSGLTHCDRTCLPIIIRRPAASRGIRLPAA